MSSEVTIPADEKTLRAEYKKLVQRNNKLNERVLELYTLYNISRTLSTSLQVSDLFELIAGLISEALNVDQYCLLFLDEELQTLHVRASHGLPAAVGACDHIKVDDGVCGRVVTSGQPVLIDDVREEKAFFYFPGSGINEGSFLGVPLKNTSGSVLGILCVHKPVVSGFSESDSRLFTAVAEHVAIAVNNAFTFEQTQELVRKDELTGLYNRRYFFERFEREIYRSRRYQRTISLLMIDIDHFKEFNDNYGHLRGDQVLRRMGRILHDSLRQIDVVGRYGGEEFLVLLPETHKKEAVLVGEKLRRAVAEANFNDDLDNREVRRLTVTIGVACIPDDANEPLLALDIADKALYLGKAQGRNQVCAQLPPEKD